MLANRALRDKIRPTFLQQRFQTARYDLRNHRHWAYLSSHPEIALLTKTLTIWEDEESSEAKDAAKVKQVLPLFRNIKELHVKITTNWTFYFDQTLDHGIQKLRATIEDKDLARCVTLTFSFFL